MGRLVEQFLKFGVVGVLATVIDFGVLVLLHELAGVNPVPAAAASFLVSLVFNYLASMRFVFTRREDLSRSREFVAFVALSAVGLALNELIMWGGEHAFVALGVDYASGPYYVLVKVLATGIVMVWNFWSRRRWLDAGDRG